MLDSTQSRMLQSSHANRPKRSLSPSSGANHNKRQAPSCQLYTAPVLASVLPVYAPVALTWNPTCVKFSSPNVDLFLSVLQPDGLQPVHRWTGVPYAAGQLATQLNPTWWNASTGAGSVRAQLVMTPVGNPIWNTAAPSGPLFTITYNGSYPSVTASAGAAVYTGPSVESVSSPTPSSFGGGKLAAAVVIPILALAGLLAAYIIWNKSKKKPEKKRWSQAIDQRMSMMSQGSWAPPRPSTSSSARPTSSSARPTSMYDPSRPYLGHRPSPSLHSVGPLSNSSPLRSSTFVGGEDLSPTKSSASSPLAPRRPLSTATAASTEMRQIGQGERMSRVSFASERPAMVGGKEKPNRTSYHGKKSIGSAVRTSMAGSMAGSTASLEPESPSPPPKTDMARSETTEELANPLVPTKPAYRRAHSSQRSVTSSLRQEVSGDATKSPFSDSSSNPLPLPKPAAAVVASHSHMPMAKRNSMLTPDEAMASYHAARGEVPPLPIPTSKSTGSLRRPGIGRSASMTFLRSASGRILKSLQKDNKTGLGSTNEDSEDGPTDASPFNDPASSPSSSNHSSTTVDDKSPFDSSRDDLTPPSLPRSLSNTPIAERFATTVYAASTPRTPPTSESTSASPLPIPTNRHLSAAIESTTARNSVVDSIYSQDGVEPAEEGPKAM